MDLAVQLGRLRLKCPIMVASGTFGYAREMASIVDLSSLGAILPKTITLAPRLGNTPWRTVETAAGLLNSIGLDNDGIDAFVEHHLPYLRRLDTAVVVSIAGGNYDEFVQLAERLDSQEGVDAIELNISCLWNRSRNVSSRCPWRRQRLWLARTHQVDAQRNRYYRGRECREYSRDGRNFVDQYVIGNGHRLAGTATLIGKCHGRLEWASH